MPADGAVFQPKPCRLAQIISGCWQGDRRHSSHLKGCPSLVDAPTTCTCASLRAAAKPVSQPTHIYLPSNVFSHLPVCNSPALWLALEGTDADTVSSKLTMCYMRCFVAMAARWGEGVQWGCNSMSPAKAEPSSTRTAFLCLPVPSRAH